MAINLSCVTAHDEQWPQDTSSSGRRRVKEDTDNILVVTAASVTSSSISRTSLNKICEIGLHHSEAAPTFYPPARGCLYCSPMHFVPLAPCWLLCTSRHKPLKAKETFETFSSFLREATCCTITNALFFFFFNVTDSLRGMDATCFLLFTCADRGSSDCWVFYGKKEFKPIKVCYGQGYNRWQT